MPENTDKNKVKELCLKATAYLNAAEKEVSKLKNLFVHRLLSDIQTGIGELEKRDPKHYNKHNYQEKFDMLKADFNAAKMKKEDNMSLYEEFIKFNDEAKNKITTMYRSYKRIQRDIELHGKELDKKEE